MSFWKMAVSGALGFAIGAGLMMMPNGNKWRKTVLRKRKTCAAPRGTGKRTCRGAAPCIPAQGIYPLGIPI